MQRPILVLLMLALGIVQVSVVGIESIGSIRDFASSVGPPVRIVPTPDIASRI